MKLSDQNRIRRNQDSGCYRLTLVKADAAPTTKRYSSWRKAYTDYTTALKTGQYLFGLIVELNEDDLTFLSERDRFMFDEGKQQFMNRRTTPFLKSE